MFSIFDVIMISKSRNGARQRKYEKGKHWKSLYFSVLKQLDWIEAVSAPAIQVGALAIQVGIIFYLSAASC